MSNRETLLAATASQTTPPAPASKTAGIGQGTTLLLFVVLAGRGGTGKTFLLRWICERLFAASRSVVIADGDRTNRTLPLFFQDVQTPRSADDRVVRRWLEDIIEQMVAQKFSVIVDLGGGDMVLKQLATELDLQAMLVQHGVTPVILHLVGPDVESLGYLASLQAAGPSGTPLFAPERTALILNDGLVPEGVDAAEAFEAIRQHKVVKTAVSRQAEIIAMPQLKTAYEVNRRHLSFAKAAAGETKDGLPPLGITDRTRVTMWLRAMEKAFAPIVEWLP